MATTCVNGVELYYETTGTGDCLVLTHGSWTDGTGWDRAVDRLAERYQVVVWDRRGHSRSQAGGGPGSRAEDAADLAGLIEHVDGPTRARRRQLLRCDRHLDAAHHAPRPHRHRHRPRAAAVEPPRRSQRAVLCCPPPTPTSQSWAA